MDNESESNKALNDFYRGLTNKEDYSNDGFKFRGIVNYNAFGKTFTEILDVFLIIGGYDPQIKLDVYEEGKIITSENFHLDFNPKFRGTCFRLNEESKILIIEGTNSPKLGNYNLTIQEHF